MLGFMKVVQESKGRNGELVSLVQDAMAHRTLQIVTLGLRGFDPFANVSNRKVEI